MINVLIADDEEKVCQLIYQLVDWKSMDMNVVGFAHNGIEALDQIQKISPQIVITDIRMPGLDGLELISKAKESQPDIEFVIVSGYQYFEYAQSAIKYGAADYLLKPIKKKQLVETLEKVRQHCLQRSQRLSVEEAFKVKAENDRMRQRDNFFSDVLSQDGSAEITIESVNQKYGYHMQEGMFCVTALKIDSEKEPFSGKDLTLIRDKITNTIGYVYTQYCYDASFYFKNSWIYMVLNYAEENYPVIRKQLKNGFSNLQMEKDIFPGIILSFAWGRAFHTIQSLPLSRNTAEFSIYQRLIGESTAMMDPEDFFENPARVSELITHSSQEINMAVEVLDVNRVLAEIRALETNCVSLSQKKLLSGWEIYEIVTEIGEMISVSLNRMQYSGKKREESYNLFLNQAEFCHTEERLFDVLKEMVSNFLQNIIDQKEQDDIKPIKVAKQYIQDNLGKPLTLEDVSRAAGFNASYFSTLFKKMTGENFLEYISEMRIEKAKELLRDTDLSISDICEQVGYADIKYFSKTFKKYAGINPGEFRKIYS